GCEPQPKTDPPELGGIPAPRVRAGRQHILETAFGLVSSTPEVRYLMSFFVRMRYCPETDSCQVVIQPHYSPAGEYDGEIRNEIVAPLSRQIRASLGGKISRKTCAYIASASAKDEDKLADLFILYFFAGEGPGTPGDHIWGVYQMNLAFRTFAPEMEEIAVNSLERCLCVIQQG
ncbi:MAG TPA: hypothetical protein VKO45_08185, partial [Methanomicrobiales archaeon]|nr:hypothetical protein [Methanomicrobiales archaeon]